MVPEKCEESSESEYDISDDESQSESELDSDSTVYKALPSDLLGLAIQSDHNYGLKVAAQCICPPIPVKSPNKDDNIEERIYSSFDIDPLFIFTLCFKN